MTRQWTFRVAATAVAATVLSSTALGGTVLYVDDDASCGGDGLSWGTAFCFLQDALGAAPAGTEIRVAQGTYTPDRDELHPAGTGDRAATFLLLDDITLLGGYAGLGAPDPDQRDVQANQTILSGDLSGDGLPGFVNNGENCYHVVRLAAGGAALVLDGLVVTGGNADQVGDPQPDAEGGGLRAEGSAVLNRCTLAWNTAHNGGAIFANAGSQLQLTECVVHDNHAFGFGGGLNASGAVLLADCVIQANASDFGGGGIRSSGELTLVRCTVADNVVMSGHGGGLAYFVPGSEVTHGLLIGCRFSGNSSNGRGGGIYNFSGHLTVVNCIVQGNHGAGAGLALWSGGNVLLANCTVAANSSLSSAGGIRIFYSTCQLMNCVVWGNEPSDIEFDVPFLPDVQFSNVPGAPPGPGNVASDPLFADIGSGDFRVLPGSPCIDGGHEALLPPDSQDLDGDGDTAEPIPVDLEGDPRITHLLPDMGALEFTGPFGPPADINRDAEVDISDFLLLLGDWGYCCQADLDCDGAIGDSDSQVLVDLFGPCPPDGPCPADLNGDGMIDPADFFLLLDLFGLCPHCHTDLDGDCVVGVTDFLTLLGSWTVK